MRLLQYTQYDGTPLLVAEDHIVGFFERNGEDLEGTSYWNTALLLTNSGEILIRETIPELLEMQGSTRS